MRGDERDGVCVFGVAGRAAGPPYLPAADVDPAQLRAPLPELLRAPLGTCGQTAVRRAVQVEPAGRAGPVQAAPELSAHARGDGSARPGAQAQRGEENWSTRAHSRAGQRRARAGSVPSLPLVASGAGHPSRSYPPALKSSPEGGGDARPETGFCTTALGPRESGDRCLFQQTG